MELKQWLNACLKKSFVSRVCISIFVFLNNLATLQPYGGSFPSVSKVF